MPEYEVIRDEAWWDVRQAAYLLRPEIQQEIARRRNEIDQRNAEVAEIEAKIERRAEAGLPGAQEALSRHYDLDALVTDPPLPSAKDDPAEWQAYYKEFDGRDLPLHAQYQAEKHRIGAAAPPDVGGMAAEYYERWQPSVHPDELAAERAGITYDELLAEREREVAEMYRDDDREAN